MRAFAMNDFESQPTIVDLPRPEPGPGEVLVRVRASSLNGIDLGTAAGMLKGMIEYAFPVVLGKDFAGTVEATGPGSNKFAIGDSVFGVVFNPTPLNTRAFAEFVVVPEEPHITRIPEGLDFAHAGAIGLAGTAALQAVEAIASAPGEAVLISGATGGVGALAVQLAARRGSTVIATARPGDEAEFVQGLGAAHTVDYAGDPTAAVRAIRPEGVDGIIHLAGDGVALAELLVPNGRFASTVGVGPDQLAGRPLTATSIMANPETSVLDQLASAIVAGELRVPIHRTYPLDQIGQAMADFGGGTLGKLAIAVG
jgi:NADPH:quinone reductase-like Zn-dependent oxidoreductase